jgi:hypothetical protein
MRFIGALLIVFLSLSNCAFGQQNSKPDAAATLKLMQEWSTLQTIWGVPTKQSVPGSSLELVEKESEKSPDGHTVIHYNFVVKGLPADATYDIKYWPVGGPSNRFQEIANKVRINKDGLLVCLPDMRCGDRNRPEFPLDVAIPATGKGETHRFALFSEKNPKVWLTGIATPFPNRSSDHGCQLEMVRMTPNGEFFLLFGSRFPPNQKITAEGNSAGEQHPWVTQTDAQGNFQRAELPFVIGKNSGVVEDTVTGGADCHPSISAAWGEGSRELQ